MGREIRLKGKTVKNGIFEGEAIVSKTPFGFYRAIDPHTGIVRDKRSELFGKNISGKVLVFPEGRGSTSGAMMIAEIARMGTHFGAMVNRRTEPILATGVILARVFYGQVIPTVHYLDRDPLEIIETGDIVRVDGDIGEVIVKKKI
jgi:predicted aconitase with swiveling domain